MTTDPFPKEAAARVAIGGRDVRHRRHGQGLGHDRADDGDDARLRHDRCRGAAAAARARAARSRRRHVQRDHGRRRVLDQRLRDAARQRRERRRRRRGDATRRSSTGCARSAASWRSASSAAAKARPSWSRSPSPAPRRRPRRARRPRRSPTRRSSRRRSTAAIPNWGRLIAVAGPRRRRVRAVARGGDDRIDRAVQGRPAARRSGAGGGGVPEGQRTSPSAVDLGAGQRRRPRSGPAI